MALSTALAEASVPERVAASPAAGLAARALAGVLSFTQPDESRPGGPRRPCKQGSIRTTDEWIGWSTTFVRDSGNVFLGGSDLTMTSRAE